MRRGNNDRVVEHKGIVERAGVFSLATSARSGTSAVEQTALGVRPMFDARIVVKKNTDLQGGIRRKSQVLYQRTEQRSDTHRAEAEQRYVSADRAIPMPTGLGMVSSLRGCG
jgi:hypothetical protein